MSIKTSYGRKRDGNNRFIIIAPHGAKDDLKTGIIASRLAKKLSGFLVLNNVYFKSTNRLAKRHPERVEDFNKLRWGIISRRYFWGRKKPPMRTFFSDIEKYCNWVKEVKGKKAVAIYIHGLAEEKNLIDVGCGVKNFFNSNLLLGAKKNKKSGPSSGKITLKIGYLKRLKKNLEENNLHNEPVVVTTGRIHPGWSRQSGVQFHKHDGRNDYALQLEISRALRKDNESINFTVEIIANALKKVFL